MSKSIIPTTDAARLIAKGFSLFEGMLRRIAPLEVSVDVKNVVTN